MLARSTHHIRRDRGRVQFSPPRLRPAGSPGRRGSAALRRDGPSPPLVPPAEHRAPARRPGWALLAAAVRLGLALSLTAAFASGLSLYWGRSALEPVAQRAGAWFFGWC